MMPASRKLLQKSQYPLIGCGKVQLGKLIQCCPLEPRVAQQTLCIARFTQPEMQMHAPVGVGVALFVQQPNGDDGQTGFFQAFPHGGISRRFSRCTPASRELRVTGQGLIRATRTNQHAPLVTDDGDSDGCNGFGHSVLPLDCVGNAGGHSSG